MTRRKRWILITLPPACQTEVPRSRAVQPTGPDRSAFLVAQEIMAAMSEHRVD